jgi:glutathione S-transferase
MHYVHIVALLAIFQFVFFSVMVGQARQKYGIHAPAMTGNEHFERALRVQMNTLELLICLFPALFIASAYWPAAYVAAVGAVYLVGRMVYRQAYVADPKKRGVGFLLSFSPIILLALAGLAGAVMGAIS